MRKLLLLISVLCFALVFGSSSLHAAKPVDADGDGYTSNQDCNDNDATIYPGAPELCDGKDNDCDGTIDEGCPPPSNPHSNLTYSDYPSSCMTSSCHLDKFNEMSQTNHYTWTGSAPDNSNQPGAAQGKLTNALNSYCINILGDWPACGTCHVGRGKRPDDSTADLSNIDCLVCHSEEYATQRVRLADGSMGVLTPTDTMVRNVHKPTRKICLQCHAKAGGGDAKKRGDLSLATITNSDANFDVHMNTAGPDLACQACHVFQNHKVIGKGSDLRVTDDLTRGPEVKCTTCHVGMDSGTGHAAAGASRSEGDRHVKRVACQSCHIPTYAKVATETHRDWRIKHDGQDATTCTNCPGHPQTTMVANLTPVYRFWNRKSDSYLLGDLATRTFNPATNTYPTSTPLGDITNGMLTPFKYKTAAQPIGTQNNTNCKDKLIALDTFVYLKGTGNVLDAVESGLANMGCNSNDTYSWITTDTHQMINHGVNPASGYAPCSQCHGNMRNALDLTTDSMLDKLGYKLKGPQSEICNQCHGVKNPKTHESMHNHINKTAGGSTGIGCYFCHNVARPERGKCSPCDPCASSYVDNVPFNHICPTPTY